MSEREKLLQAVQLHQSGQLKEAETLYRQILQEEGSHPDALHLSGVIAHQQGRFQEAIERIERAVQIVPQAAYFNNLGNAYRATGDQERAIAAFEESVRIQPSYAGGHYNLGRAWREEQKFEAAEEAFRSAIEHSPRFADAHNELGNLLRSQDRAEEAVEAFEQAVRIQPKRAEFYYNLGGARQQADQLHEAADALRRALELKPDYVEAHNNLGSVLKDLGQDEEALVCFEKALELAPGYAEAIAHKGVVLRRLERFDEAARCFEEALNLLPDSTDVRLAVGIELEREGRPEQALDKYQEILRSDPNFAGAWFARGAAQLSLGQLAAAAKSFEMGLQLDPENAYGWFHLGRLHSLEGEAQRAADCCRRAAQLRPDLVDLQYRLGCTLGDSGCVHEAIELFQAVVRMEPDHVDAWNALGNGLHLNNDLTGAITAYERALDIDADYYQARVNLAEMHRNLGDVRRAAPLFRSCFDSPLGKRVKLQDASMLPPIYGSEAELQEWRERLRDAYGELERQEFRYDPSQGLVPQHFYLAYQGFNERATAEQIGRLFESSFDRQRDGSRTTGDGRIRVGFLSQHFKNHTIGNLLRGLIAELSRNEFHITVFSHEPQTDEIGTQIRTAADDYIVLGMDVPHACRRISEAGLDLLFFADIGMDPWTNALCRNRLAPVQCVTWGHPLTTGADTVDYFVSSEFLEIPDAQAHYTEKLVRLNSLQFFYYHPERIEVRSRTDLNLPEDATLYTCPQTLFKFHPNFDQLLGEILRRDPRGRVILIEGPHPQWTGKLRGRFERTIPDVCQRVQFIPRLDAQGFLNLLANSEVLLETTVFGGGNTSYEGFAMNTPTVALPTEFLRCRLTLGMYRRMGWEECVARSRGEYVEIAHRLGTDRDYLMSIRERIAETKHVLFEDRESVRETERFIREAVIRSRERITLLKSA